MGAIASQSTGVSIFYSAISSGVDQRKHQSSLSLTCVRGIHRWPMNSPHKGPVTRKMFPFDDVIMFFGWLYTGSMWHCLFGQYAIFIVAISFFSYRATVSIRIPHTPRPHTPTPPHSTRSAWSINSGSIELLHKSHNASVPYLTMHQFVTEMCCYKMVHCVTFVWCIMGFVRWVYWKSLSRLQFCHSTKAEPSPVDPFSMDQARSTLKKVGPEFTNVKLGCKAAYTLKYRLCRHLLAILYQHWRFVNTICVKMCSVLI